MIYNGDKPPDYDSMFYYATAYGKKTDYRRKTAWEIIWSIFRFPELWQKYWGNHSMDSAML
jgi:hypothetical protein